VILPLLASVALGQNPNHTGTAGGAPQDMQNREWALTHVGEEINQHFKADNRLSLLEIRDDFQQLQIVNTEMMKRVFVKKNISLSQIQTALSELKKRATRLKTFLAFNDNADQKTKASAIEKKAQPGISAALLKLDASVMSFVNNPLFQQMKVLDTKLAVQANNDLDEIIRLTASLIRLTTEKKTQ
jgi:hypothetical protein